MRNCSTFVIWINSHSKLLHMTNLQCKRSFHDLRCFDVILVLSQFTHFCVEQKWTQHSCLWRKKDKYDECLHPSNWRNVQWRLLPKEKTGRLRTAGLLWIGPPRWHVSRGEHKLEIVTQRRAAEDEKPPPQKICQARGSGSCACIAELCTEKASSPDHRSLALCAHRCAWLSQLTPMKPCHGMQTGNKRDLGSLSRLATKRHGTRDAAALACGSRRSSWAARPSGPRCPPPRSSTSSAAPSTAASTAPSTCARATSARMTRAALASGEQQAGSPSGHAESDSSRPVRAAGERSACVSGLHGPPARSTSA